MKVSSISTYGQTLDAQRCQGTHENASSLVFRHLKSLWATSGKQPTKVAADLFPLRGLISRLNRALTLGIRK